MKLHTLCPCQRNISIVLFFSFFSFVRSLFLLHALTRFTHRIASHHIMLCDRALVLRNRKFIRTLLVHVHYEVENRFTLNRYFIQTNNTLSRDSAAAAEILIDIIIRLLKDKHSSHFSFCFNIAFILSSHSSSLAFASSIICWLRLQ